MKTGIKSALKWEIEDLSVHIDPFRKLNIKAIVTFYAVIDEMKPVQLPVEISETEDFCKEKECGAFESDDT
mgnify:CR=1 FL=1